MEFRMEGEVAEAGMVHVATPELLPGDKVMVTVVRQPSRERERVLGRLKGMIEILPGFDDPIEGLEWTYP